MGVEMARDGTPFFSNSFLVFRLDLRRGQRWAALIGVRTDGDLAVHLWMGVP